MIPTRLAAAAALAPAISSVIGAASEITAMPAFSADYFGSANVGRIYGLMLTAWSAGGIAGPLLISRVHDLTGSYDGALYAIAAIMLVSTILPFIVRPPRGRPAEAREPELEAERARFTRDGVPARDRTPTR